MSCGIIFLESSTVLYLKKCVRIMAGAKSEVSCRELFKKYNILPLSIKYLISILSLFCRQQRKFSKNIRIYTVYI